MSALQATPLSIDRRVLAGFLKVPSPPGKGEKVAGGRMRGLFAAFYIYQVLNGVALLA